MAAKKSKKIRENRAAKREQIVAKAREAIARDGPAEFGLNSLARAMGHSPGALYWYFESKEALVGEVQRLVFGEFGAALRERRERWVSEAEAQPADERALGVLLRFARYYMSLNDEKPEYARMIAFSLDPRVWLDEAQGAQLGPLLVQVFGEVVIAFRAAQQAEALAPGDPVARSVQFWAALQGLSQTSKLARLAPTLFEPHSLGMDSARTLLLGWGADACTLERAVAAVRDR